MGKLQVHNETAQHQSEYDAAEWASNYHCPTIRVEVYESTSTSRPAIASLHVPIFVQKEVEAFANVPLHGGRFRIKNVKRALRPSLDFNILWKPDEDSQEQCPIGDLFLKVLSGRRLGSSGARFWMKLHAPVRLYDAGSQGDWKTEVSEPTSDAVTMWSEKAERHFRVHWRTKTDEEKEKNKVPDT